MCMWREHQNLMQKSFASNVIKKFWFNVENIMWTKRVLWSIAFNVLLYKIFEDKTNEMVIIDIGN